MKDFIQIIKRFFALLSLNMKRLRHGCGGHYTFLRRSSLAATARNEIDNGMYTSFFTGW